MGIGVSVSCAGSRKRDAPDDHSSDPIAQVYLDVWPSDDLLALLRFTTAHHWVEHPYHFFGCSWLIERPVKFTNPNDALRQD